MLRHVPVNTSVRSLLGPPDPVSGSLAMGVFLVVEGQISLNLPSSLSPILVSLQVHFLALDAAPQPLYEDIVYAPALAVHADLNALLQQPASEGLAGELTPLVRVEYLRLTFAQSLFQSLNTECHLQGVGQPPGQHGPACASP